MRNLISSFLVQITNPQINPNYADEKNWDFFIWLMPQLIDLILVIGTIIFFFVFIIGGVKWISSSGDKGKIESAKNMITWAVAGFGMLLFVFLAVKVVNALFDIELGRLGGAPSEVVLNVPEGSNFNNIKDPDPQFVLSSIIEIVLVLAAVIFLFMLLFGGVKWISSAGKPVELEAAQRIIRNAIVGIIITFSIFFVGYVIGAVFDIDFAGGPLPPTPIPTPIP